MKSKDTKVSFYYVIKELITLNDNRIVRLQMIATFGHRCWLNGKITRNNPLSYHHILKKSDGGLATLDNGAILSRYRHDILHYTELYIPEAIIQINSLFKLYQHYQEQEIIDEAEYILLENYEKIKRKR